MAFVRVVAHEPAVAPGSKEHLGVYYHSEDHASLLRRLAIELVDLAVVGLGFFVIQAFSGWLEPLSALSRALMLGFAWAYLAVLKVTSVSTLGYRLLDAKLVNLQGNPVALWRSSLRFFLLALTPATILFDLLWLADDPNRQTLRDKIAETYVVRSRALPAGSAPLRFSMYFIGGLSLLLPYVPRSGARRDG
jgi:uncharacterized RDD family membrane protein YckC